MGDNRDKHERNGPRPHWKEIEEVCSRFEAAWKAGQEPRIEQYLGVDSPAEISPTQQALLTELVMVDLEHRWRRAVEHEEAGETSERAALPWRPRLDHYAARYPAFGPLKDLPDQLIGEEYRVRLLWGDRPAHEEYVERFGPGRPGLGHVLRAMDDELHVAEANRDTTSLTGVTSRVSPKGLRVHCPHCHKPIGLGESRPLTKIECPACGSSFSLIGDELTTCDTGSQRRTVAHFELVEKVGAGKFGAVWKARDTRLDCTVAVKIPHGEHLDAAEATRFVREARAAAQVSHPNVVRVREVGRVGNSVFIASDFVEGLTLRGWLDSQRLTPSQSARLCARIARALQAAHQAGVIHRDLSPRNILMDAHGEPHITDFGLAKRESGEFTLTMEGQVMGTPAYMSPEQARGEGHRADRRSDIYSLGVILYELLTGETPFRGAPGMVVLQVLRDEPINPRRLNNRIPSDLETVCLKCLEKDPGRRYQNADELAAELDRFLDGQPVGTRPVGAIGRIWRWYRHHPKATVLAAGGYATFCGVLLLLWGIAGVGICALGRLRAHDAVSTLCNILLLMALYYLPLLWAGIETLNGRTRGLWIGSGLTVAGVVLSVLGLLGIAYDVEAYGDVAARMPLFTLLTALSLMGFSLYLVAIVTRLTAGDEN